MKLKSLVFLLLTFSSMVIIHSTSFAYDPFKKSCAAASASNVCVEAQNSTTNPIYSTIHTAANIIALIAGIAAVIIIILAGLNLVTSAGNSEAATKSRKRITSALIGLVIIAVAWSLVTFVVNRVIK